MSKSIYMVTTADKYELPLFVGTAKEVAEYLGIDASTVRQYCCPSRNGKYATQRRRVFRVEVLDD